jgi:hypothetical protein
LDFEAVEKLSERSSQPFPGGAAAGCGAAATPLTPGEDASAADATTKLPKPRAGAASGKTSAGAAATVAAAAGGKVAAANTAPLRCAWRKAVSRVRTVGQYAACAKPGEASMSLRCFDE